MAISVAGMAGYTGLEQDEELKKLLSHGYTMGGEYDQTLSEQQNQKLGKKLSGTSRGVIYGPGGTFPASGMQRTTLPSMEGTLYGLESDPNPLAQYETQPGRITTPPIMPPVFLDPIPSPLPKELAYDPNRYKLTMPTEQKFDLTSKMKSFKDVYGGYGAEAEKAWQEYMKMLQTPSSVEEATKMAETEALDQLMKEIEQGTAENVATQTIDMGERGLQGSDIEAVAKAQLLTGGEKTKASARTTVLLEQLRRQAAKEAELRAAYAGKYATERGLAEKGAGYDVELYNQLMGKETELTAREKERMDLARMDIEKWTANMSEAERIRFMNLYYDMISKGQDPSQLFQTGGQQYALNPVTGQPIIDPRTGQPLTRPPDTGDRVGFEPWL